MSEVLASHGDLVLVRQDGTVSLAVAGTVLDRWDRDMWSWLAHCAVPLALQVLDRDAK
jgi:hypothetical protein